MRTIVYVDGFNLYYGALKGTSFKWLDPVEFSRRALPSGLSINKIKYFTARLSGAIDPTAPWNQQIYFNALKTRKEIEIYASRFISKSMWMPILNLPVANRSIQAPNPVALPAGDHPVAGLSKTLPVGAYRQPRRTSGPLKDALVVEVGRMEEKGSDVNLAVHLLNDAWKNLFDVAAVISNDTDLASAVHMATTERGKTVYVVNPSGKRVAQPLKDAGGRERNVRPAMLRQSQFPDPIPGTAIRKPAGW